MEILFLMILLHIIDDFVLQPICLSKLKQKSYWINECKKLNLDFEKYKTDYITALIIHGLSWAIMTHLPLFFLTEVDDVWISLSVVINAAIHAYIDNLKANKMCINLDTDQGLHLMQIMVSSTLLVIFC